jgi:hypothetical protein
LIDIKKKKGRSWITCTTTTDGKASESENGEYVCTLESEDDEKGGLQIVFFLRKGNSLSLLELGLVLCHQGWVNGDLCGCQSGSSDELQGRVAEERVSTDRIGPGEMSTHPTSFLASQRKGFSKL